MAVFIKSIFIQTTPYSNWKFSFKLLVTMAACCPPGSEPELASTYVPRGKVEKLDGLDLYCVGTVGANAIIVITDIFGPDSGRHKLICDQYADAGFYVAIPDLFRGNSYSSVDFTQLGEWCAKFTWSILKKDIDTVVSFLEKRGVSSFGIVGFCWGSWVVFHACASSKFSVGVSYHPSVTNCASLYGENDIELTKAIQCPQLLLPASNDPDTYKTGATITELKNKPFGNDCETVVFPDMVHGWVPRGDLTNPNVARDVKKAMEISIKYLQRILLKQVL